MFNFEIFDAIALSVLLPPAPSPSSTPCKILAVGKRHAFGLLQYKISLEHKIQPSVPFYFSRQRELSRPNKPQIEY